MTELDLDFSRHRSRRRMFAALAAAAAALSLLALQFAEYRETSGRLASVEASVRDGSPAPTQLRKAGGEEERREARLANEARRSLNLQWEALFETLEAVQRQNPRIRLLGLHPNPDRGTLTLGGEAPDFASLMDYLGDLRDRETVFHDVRLLNQRWIESDRGETRLAFTLSAGWRR